MQPDPRRPVDTAKAVARAGASTWGRATYRARLLPGLLVAGAQRCGTTTLFRALAAHPQVVPPLWTKGIHYFDTPDRYARGDRWYRGQFPLAGPARRRTGALGAPLTLEASPYYVFHPMGAERIAATLPGTRVVVLLRDPVERAWSAWKQETGRGFETEPFERALDLEPERLAGEVERMRADPAYASFPHQHHAYTERGHYADQLVALRSALGPEKVLALHTDQLFGPDPVHWERLLDFAGLGPHDAPRARTNTRPSGPMPAHLRTRLEAHFAPHDDRLETLLGAALPWRP